MTRPRVKLHVADGWWVAEIDVSRTESGSAVMAARWTGPVPVLNPEQRTAWLEQIKVEPWDIYRFLQGEACLSLEDVVQAAAETSASGMEAGTNAPRDVKQVLRAGLKSEPHFCLELIGMTREELLEYVFSTWARELSHVQGTSSVLEPTSRSEGERSGLAAISEWIAESAAEGALHRPGAGFHAIEIHLPRKLAFKNEAADIAALLPGLSRAEEAMKLIRERVAERARAAIPQKRHAP